MKVLIVGGGGLVGMHLGPQLVAAGHDVFAITRSQDARLDAMQAEGVVPVVTDIATPGAFDLLPAVDTVVYLAQSSRFREFPDGVDDMLAVNTAIPVRLARWAAAQGATRFVYASTGAVYGPALNRHREDETLDLGALGFYPASKLSAEVALRAMNPAIQVVIVRPFFVYGPWMNPTMLMNSLVQSIRGGQIVRLMGDEGGLLFQPTPAVDAARQVAALVAHPAPLPVYNVAASAVHSLREVAETIGAVVGVAPLLEHVPGPSQAVIADTSLIGEVLVPSTLSLEQGVRLLCGG